MTEADIISWELWHKPLARRFEIWESSENCTVAKVLSTFGCKTHVLPCDKASERKVLLLNSGAFYFLLILRKVVREDPALSRNIASMANKATKNTIQVFYVISKSNPLSKLFNFELLVCETLKKICRCTENVYGNGLFMHVCRSNHEVTLMQQQKKQAHQRAEFNFVLIKCKTLQTLRLANWWLCSEVVESQSVGGRPYGSSSQPTLLLAQINF